MIYLFYIPSSYAKIWGETKFQLPEYPRSGSKAMSVVVHAWTNYCKLTLDNILITIPWEICQILGELGTFWDRNPNKILGIFNQNCWIPHYLRNHVSSHIGHNKYSCRARKTLVLLIVAAKKDLCPFFSQFVVKQMYVLFWGFISEKTLEEICKLFAGLLQRLIQF